MVNFVALDLETATSVKSSICQIGITEVIDGKVQPSKSWWVKPKGNIYDGYNIAIHGITPKDTKNSPSFPEVWKEVKPFLEGKTVVAHNTSFDMYALRDAFDEYGIDYPTFDYFCTLRIAKHLIKGCYSYSLDVFLASNPQLIGQRAFFACKARNNHLVAHVLVQQKRLRHKSPLPHKAT